jgi:hypothetical protein
MSEEKAKRLGTVVGKLIGAGFSLIGTGIAVGILGSIAIKLGEKKKSSKLTTWEKAERDVRRNKRRRELAKARREKKKVDLEDREFEIPDFKKAVAK